LKIVICQRHQENLEEIETEIFARNSSLKELLHRTVILSQSPETALWLATECKSSGEALLVVSGTVFGAEKRYGFSETLFPAIKRTNPEAVVWVYSTMTSEGYLGCADAVLLNKMKRGSLENLVASLEHVCEHEHTPETLRAVRPIHEEARTNKQP